MPQLKPLISILGVQPLSQIDAGPPNSADIARVAAHYREAFVQSSGFASEVDDERSGSTGGVYHPVKGLSKFVQQAYREAARGIIGQGSTNVDAEVETKLDAAFNLQRELKQAADLLIALDESGDTAVPDLAGLVAGPIHEAPSLSPGCVLVEHPSMGPPGRSLVLVYDISQNLKEQHGNEDWMVRGYVVNRPFPRTCEEISGHKGLGPFGRLTIFHGGMEADGQLSVLHMRSDIEGATPINEDAGCPIYAGGRVDLINEMIVNGKTDPAEFKVVTGLWESKLEVVGTIIAEDGSQHPDLHWPEEPYWLFAAGEGAWNLAMLPPQFDVEGKYRDGRGLGVNDHVEGYNYARFWHSNASWAHATKELGASMQQAAQESGDDKAAGKGAEIASWSKLHAAVVGYARALTPQVPISYVQEFSGTESDDDTAGAASRANTDVVVDVDAASAPVASEGIVIDVSPAPVADGSGTAKPPSKDAASAWAKLRTGADQE